MRRRRSTSACEYRRVPFGERLGSIRPRASYIRSVCGCISASSAATEIMNTPRSADSTRDARAAGDGHQDARRPVPREQPRARVAPFMAFDELVDRRRLLRLSGGGHVDDEAVVDVAAALAAELRRALAAQALDRAVLACPAGTRSFLAPLQRRHLDLGAARRLGDGERDLDLEVVALALEDRRRLDVGDDVEVAGRAAVAPGLALAGQRGRASPP